MQNEASLPTPNVPSAECRENQLRDFPVHESSSSQCSARNTQKPSCIFPHSNALSVITRHRRRRKRLRCSSLSFVSIKIRLDSAFFAIATSKPSNTSDAFEDTTKSDRRVLGQLLQLRFVVDIVYSTGVGVVIAVLRSLEIA
jgi:hypothetical protein